MPSSVKIKGWITLMRPPNLPTVPGDPLAGLCLAGGIPGWNILGLAVAALLLYCAGLILNDVADIAIDRRERPKRPLPSGKMTRKNARRAGLAAGLAGVCVAGTMGLAALGAGALLFALVLVYTFVTPRGSAIGLLTLGLCRAMSVGLGIAAATPANLPGPALFAAGGVGGYIIAVSWLAAGETRTRRLDGRRWAPLAMAALVLGGVIILRHDTRHVLIMLAIAVTAVFRIGLQTIRLGRQPEPAAVSRAVGGYIRLLLLLQAAFCASQHGSLAIAAVLILLLPVSSHLGRRFYAS
jgi:4-hydroxybenzoate polyprenyltransferase